MELLRKVLQDSYLKVAINRIEVIDDMNGSCTVVVDISGTSVEGSGIGMVDAIFYASKVYFVNEYESLKSIELDDFKVSLSKRETSWANSQVPGTGNYCEVILTLKNSYGRKFDFKQSSVSLAAAAAQAVAAGVEHFINAERAYLSLHTALMDAKKRNRQDLVVRYMSEMSEIVKCTSYSELIDRLQERVE